MRRIPEWLAVVVLLFCAAGQAAGEGTPDVRLQEAQTAYDEAVELEKAGKYAEAVAKGEHALALREAVLGGSHLEVARCLDLIGAVHRLQGEMDRAEPLSQRGLAIREELLGKNHPDVAQSLNNLANLYLEQGFHGRAEPLHLRALAIREEALGKNHLLVATSLNNLAILYDQQGQYGRAEPLYQRALAIREEALGAKHPHVASTLSNLAILYSEQGLYGRAEPLYQRALAIREEVLGANHPDLAAVLSNLANIYHEQGLYGRAEPLYQRALTIKEAALGKNHPSVAISFNNLAVLYSEQGLYGRAEPLYQRALAIREAALGKKHPLVAQSLDGLADLYLKLGQYGRAESLYKRARSISEDFAGKNHPDVARALNGLADLYLKKGRYGQAEPLYHRSLAMWEAALGKNHHLVARTLNGLALLRLAQNRLDAAVPLFTRAFSVSEQRLRQEALDFSELRLATFLQLLRADEERLYALLRAHPDNASVRRLALSTALLLKGRSVEETADISRAVYRSLGAQEQSTFERLRWLRTQLAHLSLQGPGSSPPAAYQQQIQELVEQGDALEADLARRSAPLRALTALPSPADIVDRVAQALPQDGVLVEFITYEDRPLLPRAGTSKAQLRYLALVLFPDATIRALDLGPAEPINSAASHLRDALANRDASFQTQARALHALAFQPLLPLLGRSRRLFLSPDGQLALVPFAALHDGERFLVDTFDFTYLTSGKDLLPRSQETPPAASVVVLADPDFGAPLQPPASSGARTTVPAERSSSLGRFFSSLYEDPAHRSWASVPLPGTRQEAETIQRLLPKAQLFLGPEATKERLLYLPAPGILHLATHGFFLDDTPASPQSRAVGHFGALGDDPRKSRPPDPLLRSGLLFAGASSLSSPTSAPTRPAPDNALVTALELAGLDLWGTQLVVLSACDTGRGDVKLGQGVYGLRRAFIVAGAETVVMSLWQVKDDATPQLMEAYYRNLLAGRGRASALREAMLSLRASKPHPHYWAPFLVLGRDAPLRALAPDSLEPPTQ
ncbi:CHAT domain-containing tetratricopeptide repeat protein [Archangium lansingense]|uniref:Tetratricopeptide repeat protein n=1 Tax=Archangium lansingense TaxID=2995310 RepID=A0ABT4A652_9BACT|nr:tetratricopeptide repeat protein [Archangium lansinium]MCY1077129.1 tetratricopeptide repeat protein [Archangium lansinium]